MAFSDLIQRLTVGGEISAQDIQRCCPGYANVNAQQISKSIGYQATVFLLAIADLYAHRKDVYDALVAAIPPESVFNGDSAIASKVSLLYSREHDAYLRRQASGVTLKSLDGLRTELAAAFRSNSDRREYGYTTSNHWMIDVVSHSGWRRHGRNRTI